MKQNNRVMVVLACALIILIGTINLHCLHRSARAKMPAQKSAGSGEALDVSIHFSLLPSVYLNIAFDNR